jgi:hypothetical protein
MALAMPMLLGFTILLCASTRQDPPAYCGIYRSWQFDEEGIPRLQCGTWEKAQHGAAMFEFGIQLRALTPHYISQVHPPHVKSGCRFTAAYVAGFHDGPHVTNCTDAHSLWQNTRNELPITPYMSREILIMRLYALGLYQGCSEKLVS